MRFVLTCVALLAKLRTLPAHLLRLQVVFDILPETPSAKAPRDRAGYDAGAAAAVDGLAATLASLLRSPESQLFLGDVTRHANGTGGLLRLVHRRVSPQKVPEGPWPGSKNKSTVLRLRSSCFATLRHTSPQYSATVRLHTWGILRHT